MALQLPPLSGMVSEADLIGKKRLAGEEWSPICSQAAVYGPVWGVVSAPVLQIMQATIFVVVSIQSVAVMQTEKHFYTRANVRKFVVADVCNATITIIQVQ